MHMGRGDWTCEEKPKELQAPNTQYVRPVTNAYSCWLRYKYRPNLMICQILRAHHVRGNTWRTGRDSIYNRCDR